MTRACNNSIHMARQRRRGSVYIVVLGVSMIVVTLAVGGILATRVQARGSAMEGDIAGARLCAQSGLDLARLWINQDVNWRLNRTSGTWVTGLQVGGGSVSIIVVDPNDGKFADGGHDPVLITAAGFMGGARQTLSMRLDAAPVPMTTLKYALHTKGRFRVRSGRRIMGWQVYSTNSSLRNEGIIDGAVHASSIDDAGSVAGGITTGVAARPTPGSAAIDLYANRGTTISVGGIIDKRVLAPGYSSYGTPNPRGIYVVRSDADLTIRDSRISGTLVIISPGKKVTLDADVFLAPASSSQPVLIVNGDLIVKCSGSNRVLSESLNGVNFNPTGAPYNGIADTDKIDTYPCEIRGLVHVTGSVNVITDAVFRGVMMIDHSSGDAIDIDAKPSFLYDPSLHINPPEGYTSSVPMIPVAGSLTQIVN